MSQVFKYRAFISYSHRDRRWAASFHKALERYRIPRELVGKQSRDGPIPKTLFPIFRDRDELPTSANLSEAITTALRESLYLIVVCSPNAAKSLWVAEEILTFKRLGGADRILPIIVAGEPNASDRGMPDREAFPQPLRYALEAAGELSQIRVEPVAADARPDGDGPIDAKLKIVAGLLGVNFNDLKRREVAAVRRRALIAQGIAGSMAALALATGFFALRSEFQRREIARQNSDLLLRESRLLARDAQADVSAGRGGRAVATALRAFPLNFTSPDRPIAPEAIGALINAMRAPSRVHKLRGPFGERPKAVRISHDDKHALVVGDKGVAELWSLGTDQAPQTVPQSTANAKSTLFYGDDGDRRLLIWGAAGAQSISLYAERQGALRLMYTAPIKPLMNSSVLFEGREAAFLLTDQNQLALLNKRSLQFSDMVARDESLTLDKYFEAVLKRYPSVDVDRIIAANPDKQLLLLNDPEDGVVVVSLEKQHRVTVDIPNLEGQPSAQFSADGARFAVFGYGPKTAGLDEGAQLGFLVKTSGDGAPIPLDMQSDHRCARLRGQPRFRERDGAVVAIGADRAGICIWDGASGALVDRVPITETGYARELAISPQGKWALSNEGEIPTTLWSTERQLRFNNSALAAHTFERVRLCEGEFGTEPCAIAPAAGVQIKDGAIVYTNGQTESNWRHFEPTWSSRDGFLLSPSGRYLAVISPKATKTDDRESTAGKTVALLDLETRTALCRTRLGAGELQDLRNVFVFDIGPSLFLEKAHGMGAPALARANCANTKPQLEQNWWFRHEKNGDTGVLSVIHDARISTNGDQLLTLANDRTWRLWDISSGIELTRGKTAGYSSHFAVAPNGRLRIDVSDFEGRQRWEQLALPPDTVELVSRTRRSLVTQMPSTLATDQGRGETVESR